ncbi:hypothetical protein AAHA92_20505 [Salvia divinorum]|uniref:Uncharacterized protein n=1 Tax=Salvia divinorum TaxID=28513 RepID=A0ABD1GKE9_SALDI
MSNSKRSGGVCGIGTSSEGRTGIGFNADGDYKIDCDDEQWEQIVKADKNAKLCAPNAAADGVRAQQAARSQCNENDYHPSFEDFPFDVTNPVAEQADINDNSSGNDEMQTSMNKACTLKRKNLSNDDALMEFLANLHAETNSRLEVISSRIGYEFDLGKARQEVFNKLGSVEGLTLDEKYELCDILGDKSQRLEVFMGMPPNARLGYVTRLLKHNRKDK